MCIAESRFWKQQSQQQDTAQQDEINQKELNQFCKDSLKWIKNHPDAWPFFEPVNYDEVPDYYDVIADPIGFYFTFLISIRFILILIIYYLLFRFILYYFYYYDYYDYYY